MEKKKKLKKIESFEDALTELEEIARELESGELGLDDAIERYSEGITYAHYCKKKLEDAERKIEILQKGKGGVQASEIGIKSNTGEIDDEDDLQGSLL